VLGVVLGLAASPRPAIADRLGSLTASLGSRVEKERISAAVQLGKLRDPRAVRPLAAALADPSNVVRAVAAGALGFIGDPAALPALRAAAGDPDRTVRRRIAEAIARFDRQDAAPRPDLPLARYQLDAREPRLNRPRIYLVMKSAADRSHGRASAGTRRLLAGKLRTYLLRDLGESRRVTLEPSEAERLGIEPFALDVTIVKLDRGVAGPYVEVACELRVAVSTRRGQMLSFLTGGAKVQVPRRGFQGAAEGQLALEALENAVKSLNQDLIAFLDKQPRPGSG
jgi:hypothetical protein